MSNLTIEVLKTSEPSENKPNIRITYKSINKYTNRQISHHFNVNQYEFEISDIERIASVVLGRLTHTALFGKNYRSPYMDPVEVKKIMTQAMRLERRGLKKHSIDPNPAKTALSDYIYIPSADSFFKPEKTGKTFCVMGSSFSGKTTLLVNQLNRLEKADYDMIFLFTESVHAEPLKTLNKDLNIKIYDNFNPEIPQILRKINIQTNNRFRFLVILDDVINELRGNTLIKMILTMRNSNISTILLVQYPKLIGPNQRNSIHEYYFTKLRTDDWVYMNNGFIGQHIKEILHESGSGHKIAELTKNITNGKIDGNEYIIKYNQRRDEINLIPRDLV